jgi:hypothetical protein
MLSSNKFYSVETAAASERKKILWILFIICAVGILNIYLNPLEHFFTDVIGIPSINGCPLYTFTNIPCPMCGMGRVFSCLTDLYISQSFYYNPLGLLFYVVFGSIFFVVLVLAIVNKRIVLRKAAYRLWYIPVGFLCIMWILNVLYGHH